MHEMTISIDPPKLSDDAERVFGKEAFVTSVAESGPSITTPLGGCERPSVAGIVGNMIPTRLYDANGTV
jgi:hypothetical protein